jgi:hypothetical protein
VRRRAAKTQAELESAAEREVAAAPAGE